MANVIFKRGAQSSLPQVAEDGVFYLTNDTNRLYVGQGSDMRLLNQTVQFVSSATALPAFTSNEAKTAHTNDFYYCQAENILATWNGTEWVQINPDKNYYLQSATVTSEATGNIGTLSTDLALHTEGTLPTGFQDHITATFGIEVDGGLAIAAATATGATPGVLITGKEYSLDQSVTGNAAIINLNSTLGGNTATVSTINLKVGSLLTVTTGTNSIVIDAKDQGLSSAVFDFDTNGRPYIEITDGQANSVTASMADVGLVLNDGTVTRLADITNTATANRAAIYSKAEVDRLFAGVDGMTYRGAITSATGTGSLPSSGVHVGDVYIVASSTIKHTVLDDDNTFEAIPAFPTATEYLTIGDMFIASGGTENDNGEITSGLTWTYIPSGDEKLDQVTYSADIDADSHNITVVNASNDSIFGIQLNASTGISIVSTTATAGLGPGETLINTIAHSEYATTATSTTSNGATFTAISGINVNNGHVISINTETYTPITYDLRDGLEEVGLAATCNFSVINGTRMATATNAGANDLQVGVTLHTSNDDYVSGAILKMTSSTIKLSKGSDGEVVMNMEWGSF